MIPQLPIGVGNIIPYSSEHFSVVRVVLFYQVNCLLEICQSQVVQSHIAVQSAGMVGIPGIQTFQGIRCQRKAVAHLLESGCVIELIVILLPQLLQKRPALPFIRLQCHAADLTHDRVDGEESLLAGKPVIVHESFKRILLRILQAI